MVLNKNKSKTIFAVCLTKVQRVKYLNGFLRKLMMLIFLGSEIYVKFSLEKRIDHLEENLFSCGQERIDHLKKKNYGE